MCDEVDARTFRGVWDLHALAVGAPELPAVKWALQALAHHLPPGAQVRAQMRAVRVQHVRHAVVVAEHCQRQTCVNIQLQYKLQ